jgi:hypothetical protein
LTNDAGRSNVAGTTASTLVTRCEDGLGFWTTRAASSPSISFYLPVSVGSQTHLDGSNTRQSGTEGSTSQRQSHQFSKAGQHGAPKICCTAYSLIWSSSAIRGATKRSLLRGVLLRWSRGPTSNVGTAIVTLAIKPSISTSHSLAGALLD